MDFFKGSSMLARSSSSFPLRLEITTENDLKQKKKKKQDTKLYFHEKSVILFFKLPFHLHLEESRTNRIAILHRRNPQPTH